MEKIKSIESVAVVIYFFIGFFSAYFFTDKLGLNVLRNTLENVVIDKRVITGRNPQSTRKVGKEILSELKDIKSINSKNFIIPN